MEKDQYFQEPDSSPGLNLDKTGIEGAPPSIKSFEELQQESGAGSLDLPQNVGA